MTKKRIYDKPVKIDMGFEEALKRASRVTKDEVDRNIARAKKVKDDKSK